MTEALKNHANLRGRVSQVCTTAKQKCLQNPPKIHPKFIKNNQQSWFGGVRRALGRGLGAMVAPRGAQELQNIRKPHSRSTLGLLFGRHFLVFLIFFVKTIGFGPSFSTFIFRSRFFMVFWPPRGTQNPGKSSKTLVALHENKV